MVHSNEMVSFEICRLFLEDVFMNRSYLLRFAALALFAVAASSVAINSASGWQAVTAAEAQEIVGGQKACAWDPAYCGPYDNVPAPPECVATWCVIPCGCTWGEESGAILFCANTQTFSGCTRVHLPEDCSL